MHNTVIEWYERKPDDENDSIYRTSVRPEDRICEEKQSISLIFVCFCVITIQKKKHGDKNECL